METKWVVVPQEPTPGMSAAGFAVSEAEHDPAGVYRAMLAAAPEPLHQTLTTEEARDYQRWAGMDGACAFHLIERHADGWDDVARMMDAWLEANQIKAPMLSIPGIKNPGCFCARCDMEFNVLRTRMSLCPECGDKRCPRAEDHRNECSKTPNVVANRAPGTD